MVDFKLTIGDLKSGKAYKKDVSGDEAEAFLGKKIGDKITGSKVGFAGYEFEITGGSDSSGFPMRKDVSGTARKRILLVSGLGTRHKRKGMKKRKLVAGNMIHTKTTQINLKVLKSGKTPLGEAPTVEAAPKEAEEKKEEAKPAPEAKAEEKVEEKPKAEEKPKEEPKQEAKPEEKKE